MVNKNVFYTCVVFLTLILGLANSGLHPVSSNAGYTGAPGDANCSQCHNGSNQSIEGTISISGLPDTILTNTTYRISVIITNPNKTAKKAGFQLVALGGTNFNAGTMSNNSPKTDLRTVFGGKTYFGHAPADSFPHTDTLKYFVDWTSPMGTGINPIIKFYTAGVLANGNDDTSGDKIVARSLQIPIRAAVTPLSVNIFDVTSAKCADTPDGSAKAVPSGGSGIYDFLWSNGITTDINQNMKPGLNSVTVTDNSGSSISANVTIPSPPAINISFSLKPACDSSSLGNITAIPEGGIGQYNYLWSDGHQNNILINKMPGIYTVTVTDQNNCSNSAETAIYVLPPIGISSQVFNPLCAGDSNGKIGISVIGGLPDYRFLWSTGDTIQHLEKLKAGSYSVTITDSIGCVLKDTFSIIDTDSLKIQIDKQADPDCFQGKNGQIAIKALGGTPGYQFSWFDGTANSGNTSKIENLSAGIYTVTVTDILDCSIVNEIKLSDPTPLSFSGNVKNVRCHMGNDGAIQIKVNGSVNPMLFNWSNSSTSQNLSDLRVGKYVLTLTDSIKKCTVTDSFEITQPEQLVTNADSIIHNTCFGSANGNVKLTVSGGTKQYAFLWSNQDTSAAIYNLKAGPYQYTVTDANLCKNTGQVIIKEPPAITISVDSIKKARCTEVNDGYLAIKVKNNQGFFKVKWSNDSTELTLKNLFKGSINVNIKDSLGCEAKDTFFIDSDPAFTLPEIQSIQNRCQGDTTGQIWVEQDTSLRYKWSTGDTTHTVAWLADGMYTLYATDISGCRSKSDTVFLQSPPKIETKLMPSDTLICHSTKTGTLNLIAKGGSMPYRIAWSTGDTLLNISGLSTGNYSITITDKNNCYHKDSFSIKAADSLYIADKKINDIICTNLNTGSIELNVKGGFGDYTYSWSDSLASGSILVGLAKGQYTVTITDKNGCRVHETFSIKKIDSLTVTIKVADETVAGKFDGAAELNILGGTPPFTVIWSNGRTGPVVDNMPPGLYTFAIEDKNKCRQSGFVVIGGGTCLLSAKIKSIKSPTCFNSADGKIELDIQGSFSKIYIEIYNQKGLYKLPIDSLKPDKYTLIINDSVFCSSLISDIDIKPLNPPIVLEKIIKNGPGTTSLKNGRMEAFATGGTGSLKYVWYKGNEKVGDSALVENLTVGTYTLSVIDSAGCELVTNNIQLSVLSTIDDNILSGLKIFPNPASYNIYLENTTGLEINKVEIYNSSGQYQFDSFVEQHTNASTSEISFPDHFNSGIYFIKIFINDHVTIKRFIILK